MSNPASSHVVVGPGFVAFAQETEPRLRRALVAGFGADLGREATSEALAYGWEHWERIRVMDNPAGYLYRVGRNWARRRFVKRPLFPIPAAGHEPWVEPGLAPALRSLTVRQRQVVVLVHAMDLTQAEAAALLGLSSSSVRNHLDRGLAKLRSALGVTDAG
jgi:RNA polymerase sigma-70 factor (ECF subfamily)